MLLPREEDMQISGGRHPFCGAYAVKAEPDGKLRDVDIHLWANGGATEATTKDVLDRGLAHSCNAYALPNLRASGVPLKTNIPSYTAFRGFGAPQSMFVTETAIDHVARTLGEHPEVIRERNLLDVDGLTHYRQPVPQNSVRRIWDQVMDSAEVPYENSRVPFFVVAESEKCCVWTRCMPVDERSPRSTKRGRIARRR